VKGLPTINRLVLKSLLSLFQTIIQNKQRSLMDARALSNIFGPCLLFPKAKDEDWNSVTAANQVVEALITNHGSLFTTVRFH
jgi:hypothetical protein